MKIAAISASRADAAFSEGVLLEEEKRHPRATAVEGSRTRHRIADGRYRGLPEEPDEAGST